MDNLPPEVLRRILPYLNTRGRYLSEINESIPSTSLAAYATLSRKWQSVVEPITFRHLVLSPVRLDVANTYNYLGPTRLAYIRHIFFNIEFPAHDLYVSTDPKDYDDQFVFNKAVGQILSLLARTPPREKPLLSLTLSISPSREHDIVWYKYEESENDKVLSGRLRKTYLELNANWDRSIQELPGISQFRVGTGSRAILFAPASINLIASKMTRLQKIELQLDDAEKANTEVRIHQRSAFANTLKDLPVSIESFRLEYIREPPRDRTFQAPSIVLADATGDIFSQELRNFSQRDGLKELTIEASVDATVLWPWSQCPQNQLIWPTLEQVHIALNEVLPSGEWIEMPDPEEEEENEELNEDEAEDERLNSEIPGEENARWFGQLTYNPVHFERFALATARAASRMKKIKDLKVTYHGYAEMGICFTTENRVYSRGKEPFLEFASGDRFPELSEGTMNAWRSTLKLHDLEWDVHFTDCGRAPMYHFERLDEIFVEH